MGQAITKLMNPIIREMKSFNIERRAEKVISQDKPKPAPMYPSTLKELERLKAENVSTDYLHKKDEQLDGFLKKIYVSTPDPAPPLERKINPDRPLPVSRTADFGITYGYSEAEEATVPEGRVSLKQALTFISNHQNDPRKYSSAAIASQYKISLADTNDILEHFKMFSVKVQKKHKDPASLSVYERLQLKVQNMTVYNAPDIMREVQAVYGKDYGKEEMAVAPKKQSENDLEDENFVRGKTSGPNTAASQSREFKDESMVNKEKSNPKSEKLKEEPAKKHSQENG